MFHLQEFFRLTECIYWVYWVIEFFPFVYKYVELATEWVPALRNNAVIIFCAKNSSYYYRNSHQRCSIKKAVLEDFKTFIEVHLRWSLFFIKVLRSATFWWFFDDAIDDEEIKCSHPIFHAVFQLSLLVKLNKLSLLWEIFIL